MSFEELETAVAQAQSAAYAAQRLVNETEDEIARCDERGDDCSLHHVREVGVTADGFPIWRSVWYGRVLEARDAWKHLFALTGELTRAKRGRWN